MAKSLLSHGGGSNCTRVANSTHCHLQPWGCTHICGDTSCRCPWPPAILQRFTMACTEYVLSTAATMRMYMQTAVLWSDQHFQLLAGAPSVYTCVTPAGTDAMELTRSASCIKVCKYANLMHACNSWRIVCNTSVNATQVYMQGERGTLRKLGALLGAVVCAALFEMKQHQC